MDAKVHPYFGIDGVGGGAESMASICMYIHLTAGCFYSCMSLSWLLIFTRKCADTHTHARTEKHSVQWLPALPLRGPFAVTTKLIISLLQQAVFAASRFFSQMPTLLFVEMLPSWHRLKYVCVFVWMFASGWVFVAVALCVCAFGGWVGVYVKWKAVRMEGWMTQTGHSGGRLVSGPYSHYQAGCSIWQLTESLQAPSLHKRSALQSDPLSGCLSFSHAAAKPQHAPLIHT